MSMNDLPQGEKYIRNHRFHKRWHKVLMGLSSIVAFCTICALILPAITMERTCPIPEHIHRRLLHAGIACAENDSHLHAGDAECSSAHF